MKTLTHQTSTFFPQGPERQVSSADPYLIKLIVPLVLLAILFSSALWYFFSAPSRVVPVSAPQTSLELSLSGAYSSNLSLGQNELSLVQSGPSGFTLASKAGALLPFKLSFNGDAAETSRNSSFFLTGARDDLSLTLAGVPYTLQSGNLTVTPGGRTFYATFSNAQGQPLEVSGNLTF